MQENKFSVVIPAYNKEEGISRCLQSLISQTYGKFEAIIVDDGSTDGTRNLVKSFMRDKRFRAFFLSENSGRLVARNVGMRMSRNEWICWLDADDEYMPTYFENYNNAINANPGINIFTSGMLIKNRKRENGEIVEDGYRIIEPFKIHDYENFGQGRIGSGSFVFHRSLMWYFPEDVKNPYGLEKTFPAALVERDPAFREICKQDAEGHWLPLGNPWGDDYSYIWYLTRKNKIKTINSILYTQYVRV